VRIRTVHNAHDVIIAAISHTMGFFGVINQAPRLVHSIVVVFEREAVDLTS